MSIGIDRAKQIIENGGPKASAYKFMTEKSNELLSTILVGNNIANILAASLMTSMVTRYFSERGVGIAVFITTLLTLIFGEIIPKTIGRNNAEKFSFIILKILEINYYLMFPIIKTFSWITQIILGDGAHQKVRRIHKGDIEYMVNKAEQDKSIDSKQLELLNSILEFPTIKVKDIMIPRNRVTAIKYNSSFHEIISLMRIASHSRYAVYKGELERTVGFLHAKDLAFIHSREREDFKIDKYLKPPFFVYEHMKIQSVFDYMNRKKVHLALVKDENGLIVGIITLEDIIEEIVGEIEDEHDFPTIEDPTQSDETLETGITINGSMSIRDLDTEFDVKIPLNDNFSTVAGFILDMLGSEFPEEGQIIIWEGYSFDLTSVKNHEIREITIKNINNEKREPSVNSNEN